MTLELIGHDGCFGEPDGCRQQLGATCQSPNVREDLRPADWSAWNCPKAEAAPIPSRRCIERIPRQAPQQPG
jgi:hypothetical protein